jgi:hypothetical protein
MPAPASNAPLCVACGTQYPPGPAPSTCFICEDERQYVPAAGQAWTTLDALRRTHENVCEPLDTGIYSILTRPAFGIGQRALLVRSPGGNVLWDCVALLDTSTLDLIHAFGGIACIAISHPHYYTSMVEWAHALEVPVYLHAADRDWVARPDSALRFWEGDRLDLHDDIALIRCGGHFEGGTVLHWPGGAGGRGALLSGDILQVVPDRRHVSFMRSYPNLIPLSARAVMRIVGAVEPLAFERVYGAFHEREIERDGREAVRTSARRYLEWIGAHEAAAPDAGPDAARGPAQPHA